MPCLRITAISLLVGAALLGSASAETPDSYTLGPQDQLQVKVSDLRAGTGEAYQWTAFYPGEFTVAPSGKVSLPIVGELEASGRTTADLEAAIAAKLQTRVGLAEKPDASVQIIKFRPFYVMGSVDRPGEYDYRPDLTVLQAVSVAGGMERVATDALLGYARDALSSRGDLRVLTADRISYLARQARLDAEIRGEDAVGFPDDLRAKARDPDVARILREEQLFFEARRNGLQAQVAAVERNKQYLQHEIESLNAKDATTARQIELSRKELDQVAGLVSKGLTVLPRQLELEQTTAQLEGNRLDVQLAVIHAQEDISKADRDIIDLKNTRRNDALQEETDIRDKLAETTEKIETAQNLIVQSEVRAPMAVLADTSAHVQPDYFITRRTDGKAETRPAQEDDLVRPGDVVRVLPKSRSTLGTPAQISGGGPDLSRSASTF